MFGSPSFVMPGQLRNPTALLQRTAMPVTNASPRAAGLLNPGVAKPLQGAMPISTPTIPNTQPAKLLGNTAMRKPMGFGTAINQPLT